MSLSSANFQQKYSIQHISNRMQEITRLKSLIPARLQNTVQLECSIDAQPKLLVTRRINRDRCLIQVDGRKWQSLDLDLRNLLFWHELARIDHGAICSHRSTYITLAASLGLGLIDLPTQNIGMLVSALLIAGLAGYKLYQHQLGEQHLRQLTTADRAAIDFAVEFGYDRQTACELLKSAISQTQKLLSRSGIHSTRHAARLQVLNLSLGDDL
jgi:Protein of unknown function (DUF3318)